MGSPDRMTNGSGGANKPRPGDLPGGEDDVRVTEDELRPLVAALETSLEPRELRAQQAHNNMLANRVYTEADDAAVYELALQVLPRAFELADPKPVFELIRACIGRLIATKPLAARVMESVRARPIEPLGDEPTAEEVEARGQELRRLLAGDPLSAEMMRRAEETLGEWLDELAERAEEAINTAPKAAVELIGRCIEQLKKAHGSEPPDRSAAIDALEATAARIANVGRLAGQVTDNVYQMAGQIAREAARKADASARTEVVRTICQVAMRLVWPRCVRALKIVRAGADERIDAQQHALDLLRNRFSEPDELPDGTGLVEDVSGGRAVRLATPGIEEIQEAALLKRGVADLRSLALAYRRALAEVIAPRTRDDAYELAEALVRLIATDADVHSVYAQIGTVAEAVRVSGELYHRAAELGSLQHAEPELGVLLARHEHVELPDAATEAEAKIRGAVLAELRRLSGGRIRVVERPSDVSSIAVMKLTAGFPSCCDRANTVLLASYRLLRVHDPKTPPGTMSRTVGGPDGWLDSVAPANRPAPTPNTTPNGNGNHHQEVRSHGQAE